MSKVRETTLTFMSSLGIASMIALSCVFVQFHVFMGRFILILLHGTSWLFGTTLSSVLEPPMRLSSSSLLLKLLCEGFWCSKRAELFNFVLFALPMRLLSSLLLLKLLCGGFWCFKRAENLKFILIGPSMRLSSLPPLLKLFCEGFCCSKRV